KGSVKIADSGINLTYPEDSELGTIKMNEVSEDLSDAIYSQLGYYDRMNVGDEIVLVKKEDLEKKRSEYNPNDMLHPLMISEFSKLLDDIR
ncbi:MAG: hypothetical protein K5839_06460, partial [Treponemataceae bacterium]|nr:hypothetical protein [Treponemataceae bacterium]